MLDLSGSMEKDQDTMHEIVELSLLYDFYGALLKEQKRQVFEDYILNDLSLSEIAQERSISRQAVHEMVKRCSRELKDYEEKLHLVEKFEEIKSKVNQIHQTAGIIRTSADLSDILQIETLSNEILDVL